MKKILYFIADLTTGEMVDDSDYFESLDQANIELDNYPDCFVDSLVVEEKNELYRIKV